MQQMVTEQNASQKNEAHQNDTHWSDIQQIETEQNATFKMTLSYSRSLQCLLINIIIMHAD
jgi:hypothetical protein